jgi:hypothetical protein
MLTFSLGMNGHAHDTSSAMPRWIDHALAARGRRVSVGAGNARQVEPDGPGDPGFVTGRTDAIGRFAGTGVRHELGRGRGRQRRGRHLGERAGDRYRPQARSEVEIRPPGGAWIVPISPGRKIRIELIAADGCIKSAVEYQRGQKGSQA